MAKYIGILTAGGDSPGLNAAIRGVGKAAIGSLWHGGDRFPRRLSGLDAGPHHAPGRATPSSGILTPGGTILGTSRDKPHRMPVGDKHARHDRRHRRAPTSAPPRRARLPRRRGHSEECAASQEKGLNVITLPKTIDNDVALTDITFGFDTALGIATEAIDRLHSTAHSHHRIIVVEMMGHRTAGWRWARASPAGPTSS